MLNGLNEILKIKHQVLIAIDKEVNSLLINLSRLNDDELISLAKTIVRLNKELGYKWYIEDLLDKLSNIKIKSDPLFSFITKMQEDDLIRVIEDLTKIKNKCF